jgi:glycosyltransferase involved in cell wall biosynthesis
MPRGGVSVVLCTRNGYSKGFLDATLNSVFAQSVPPYEVIVVDDGSTDGTADHVKRAYPGVRLLANSRSGLAAARNTGAAEARGRWIAFVDDDDLWRPEKLAAQLRHVSDSDDAEDIISASRLVAVDADGLNAKTERRTDHLARWPACLLGSAILPSGALMPRATLLKVGGFDERLPAASAYEFWIRCLSSGVTVRFTDAVVVAYRRHSAQMTGSSRSVELMLRCEMIISPHLQGLPDEIAARLGAVRVLTTCRSLALRLGVRAAVDYWRRTRLRPLRFDWRSGVYLLLDGAALVLPLSTGATLRDVGVRLITECDYRN